MDAIVTAGGVPEPGEPLYEFTQGQPKALLDVCGKPMIQWVLDALNEAETVDQIVIIGLTSDHGLTCPKIKAYIPDQGGMLDNIKTGTHKVKELNPSAEFVLVVSSDIPGITTESVNWVVNTAIQTKDDLYYNVISRSTMETRYPGSKRSYLRLKDVEVCGGDMNVIRSSKVDEDSAFWEKMIATRKNALKQVLLIGVDTLLLVLLRQLTMQKAVERVARKVKLSGRALLCPHAEVGMDVDKPFQLELMRADLAKRGACQG
jgi:GTP:adenosylcobinamide-phosphate guanylyltransferase